MTGHTENGKITVDRGHVNIEDRPSTAADFLEYVQSKIKTVGMDSDFKNVHPFALSELKREYERSGSRIVSNSVVVEIIEHACITLSADQNDIVRTQVYNAQQRRDEERADTKRIEMEKLGYSPISQDMFDAAIEQKKKIEVINGGKPVVCRPFQSVVSGYNQQILFLGKCSRNGYSLYRLMSTDNETFARITN